MKSVCPLCKGKFDSILYNIKENQEYEEYAIPKPVQTFRGIRETSGRVRPATVTQSVIFFWTIRIRKIRTRTILTWAIRIRTFVLPDLEENKIKMNLQFYSLSVHLSFNFMQILGIQKQKFCAAKAVFCAGILYSFCGSLS